MIPAHWLVSLRNFDLRELASGNMGAWSPARKTTVALVWLGLVLVSGHALLLQLPSSRL
ncbi:hypothetical protein [Pseudomonas bubulae]